MIVDYPEIEARLKKTFTTSQALAVQSALVGLEAEVEVFLDRPLVPTTITAEVVRPPTQKYPGKLFFRRGPVRSISSITVDGTAVDAADYARTPYGVRYFAPLAVWGGVNAEPEILATYEAGLDGDDRTTESGKAIAEVLIRAGSRIANQILDDSVGVATEDQEGYSVEYADASQGLTEAERAMIRRFRRRVIR